MHTTERELSIGEFERSIIALSKRKLKRLQEVQQMNTHIAFLRKQQEQMTNV